MDQQITGLKEMTSYEAFRGRHSTAGKGKNE